MELEYLSSYLWVEGESRRSEKGPDFKCVSFLSTNYLWKHILFVNCLFFLSVILIKYYINYRNIFFYIYYPISDTRIEVD